MLLEFVIIIIQFFTGNIGFILAIITIFRGMEYIEIEAPMEITYLLIGYIVVHVLTHLILTGQLLHSDREIDSAQAKDVNANEPLDDPGSGFRKTLAILYIGFVYIISFSIIGCMVSAHSS